jgi:hypothetical protein
MVRVHSQRGRSLTENRPVVVRALLSQRQQGPKNIVYSGVGYMINGSRCEASHIFHRNFGRLLSSRWTHRWGPSAYPCEHSVVIGPPAGGSPADLRSRWDFRLLVKSASDFRYGLPMEPGRPPRLGWPRPRGSLSDRSRPSFIPTLLAATVGRNTHCQKVL